MAEPINSEDLNSLDVQAEKKEAEKIGAKLFDTKIFSDVTFDVNGVEFPAHKCILSTRYKYFESMFRSDWNEADPKKPIEILGIAPDIFKIVLEFIYKGELSDWKVKWKTHAVDLIKAADMVCSKTCLETIGYFI